MVQRMRGRDRDRLCRLRAGGGSAGESLNVSERLYARATPSMPAACFRPNHFSQACCRPASTDSLSSSGGDPRPSTFAKLTYPSIRRHTAEAVRASKDGDDGDSDGRRPAFAGCDVVRESIDGRCGGVGGGVSGPKDCGDSPGE
jgi:hypothetical protein